MLEQLKAFLDENFLQTSVSLFDLPDEISVLFKEIANLPKNSAFTKGSADFRYIHLEPASEFRLTANPTAMTIGLPAAGRVWIAVCIMLYVYLYQFTNKTFHNMLPIRDQLEAVLANEFPQ
jgi:hypothetical protein